MSGERNITSAAEGAEALVMALLNTYADADDDDLVPFRRLLVEVGRACGVEMELGARLALPEEVTVAELRRRSRVAREGLARVDALTKDSPA